MRRCLDCPRLIAGGSRCAECRRAHERVRNGRRSAEARGPWARAVKERDGNRCQRCGSPEGVEAHHIRPLAQGGGDTLDNGITLCGGCHKAVHRAMRGAA